MGRCRIFPILVLLTLTLCLASCREDILKIIFVDVGYGDAIVGIPSGGVPFLVDGGGAKTAPAVIRTLEVEGVSKLGTVFCTHFHPDHAEGLVQVLETFPCSRIVVNENPTQFVSESNFAKTLSSSSPTFTRADLAQQFYPAKYLSITVLSPSDKLKGDLNTRSLVLKIEHQRVSFLLAADADDAAEREMLRHHGSALASTVLKIPHHGWGTGSSPEFLDAVIPSISILSVGPSPWPAPDPAVLARYTQRKIPVLRTDQDGTIEALSNGKTLFIKTASGKQFRIPTKPQ